MKTIIVIPARLASSRLPNKILENIHGKPMILHVIDRAQEANVGPVIVASADGEISAVVQDYGVIAVPTDPSLPSGTDRIAAALKTFDPSCSYDKVINVQGDLPSIPCEHIVLLNETLQDRTFDMTTLAAPMDAVTASAPSVVKAVLSIDPTQKVAKGIYFSRFPISASDGQLYHHIGIYGYHRSSLEKMVLFKPTPLELSEKLEQLRALENGLRIGVGIVPHAPLGVDTSKDLDIIRQNFIKTDEHLAAQA